jgi:hypothetical protein
VSTLLGVRSTAFLQLIIVSIVDQQRLGLALGAADYLLKPIRKTLRWKHTQARPNPAR